VTEALAPARPHLSVPAARDPDACPVCEAALAEGQNWCLACGAPARTRLARTPRWRLPLLVIALVIAVSIGALVFSAVRLSGASSKTVTSTVTAAQTH
jgi:uncharacterized paraquat-inducible protein A